MSLRPWTWSPLRTLSSLRIPGGTRRRKASRASRAGANDAAWRHHMSEPLEQRVMLTTINNVVGQETVFEYIQGGAYTRMRISGNISMEVLGAAVSRIDNRARIINLPGRLFPPALPPVDIAGGPGGPGGIDVIGTVFSPATGNP